MGAVIIEPDVVTEGKFIEAPTDVPFDAPKRTEAEIQRELGFG